MEMVEIVLEIFRAMDKEEKRAMVLALGQEIEESGLVDELLDEDSDSAPAESNPLEAGYVWFCHVTGINARYRGFRALRGAWLSPERWEDLDDGEVVFITVRLPKPSYAVVKRRSHSVASFAGGPDGKIKLDGAELVQECSTFTVAKELLAKFFIA